MFGLVSIASGNEKTNRASGPNQNQNDASRHLVDRKEIVPWASHDSQRWAARTNVAKRCGGACGRACWQAWQFVVCRWGGGARCPGAPHRRARGGWRVVAWVALRRPAAPRVRPRHWRVAACGSSMAHRSPAISAWAGRFRSGCFARPPRPARPVSRGMQQRWRPQRGAQRIRLFHSKTVFLNDWHVIVHCVIVTHSQLLAYQSPPPRCEPRARLAENGTDD